MRKDNPRLRLKKITSLRATRKGKKKVDFATYMSTRIKKKSIN
jgi:hypothetical protein